jgi:hypothetical protein
VLKIQNFTGLSFVGDALSTFEVRCNGSCHGFERVELND